MDGLSLHSWPPVFKTIGTVVSKLTISTFLGLSTRGVRSLLGHSRHTLLTFHLAPLVTIRLGSLSYLTSGCFSFVLLRDLTCLYWVAAHLYFIGVSFFWILAWNYFHRLNFICDCLTMSVVLICSSCPLPSVILSLGLLALIYTHQTVSRAPPPHIFWHTLMSIMSVWSWARLVLSDHLMS